MMFLKACIEVFLLCVSCVSYAQTGVRERVVFYNTENLFDTRNDTLTADDDFTPRGKQHWNRERYTRKLLNISKVLSSLGAGKFPLLIGLSEVENRGVVSDLVNKTVLADGNYGIVHADSPDARGIDVALLYRKDSFRLLHNAFLPVRLKSGETTRDILYCEGISAPNDTLHVFVCHFPSMRGGEAKSEWKRVKAASVVRQKVDSIQDIHPRAMILILGDLNGRANTSAQKTLKTRNPESGTIESENFYNTGYYLLGKNYGSYRYKGEWQTLDHIIVSGNLLNGEAGLQVSRRMGIYDADFLLEEERGTFGVRPKPTYRGPHYIGGYSDHLPVFIDLKK